jgi:hypothetical protein
MADHPWRCSACGTVNEPVANSCRSCGRWPSLFDLEASAVDDIEREDAREPAPTSTFPEPTTVDPGMLEPEVFEPEPAVPEPWAAEEDAELEDEPAPERSRRRQLASYLVPIAFAVYILLSIVFGDR